MANNSRNDNGPRLVSPFTGKLSEAGDVIKDYRSGRNPVDETRLAEGRVSRRAGKGWTTRGDDFLDAKSRMLHCFDNFHQPVIAAMGKLLALLERRRREMTVVVMKASEGQTS